MAENNPSLGCDVRAGGSRQRTGFNNRPNHRIYWTWNRNPESQWSWRWWEKGLWGLIPFGWRNQWSCCSHAAGASIQWSGRDRSQKPQPWRCRGGAASTTSPKRGWTDLPIGAATIAWWGYRILYHTASSGGPGVGQDQARPQSSDDRGGPQAGAEGQPVASPERGLAEGLFTPAGSGGPNYGRGGQAGVPMTTSTPGRNVMMNGSVQQSAQILTPEPSRVGVTGGPIPVPPPGLQGHSGQNLPDRHPLRDYRADGRQPPDGYQGGSYARMERPLGIDEHQRWNGAERAPAMGPLYGDPVKGSDLPSLPALGTDQSPLLFGDWLTLVKPSMYDLSQGSRQWWDQVVREVEDLYNQWLQASPLQRLRLRPQEGTIPPPLSRVEMKGVTMLLQILPEAVKRDIVASRTLSSANILFKLYTLFQPGGGSERTGLLKQIVEPKIPNGAADLLVGLRQWRRWISRAQELVLSLPDPTILATVLGRFADSLSKAGGHQMSFRISAARQELALDHRPTMGTTHDFAEYLQAEAEELALLSGAKSSSQAANAQTNPTPAPMVKALHTYQGSTDDQQKSHRAPCRFWKTDEGCKKGAECTYLHDATDMKGRCYGCGSTMHVKRECPVHKKQGDAQKVEKVKKMQKPKAEKSEKSEKGTSERNSSSTSTSTSKEERNKGDAKPSVIEKQTVVSDPPEVTPGTPVGGIATDELLREAASLLKSLKGQGLKAVRIKSVGEGRFGNPGEFALLDGGATNALRMAREEELPYLIPTEVELAHGTTTLYRTRGHNTLLSKTAVEPIIPLGWLVQSGYHIDWGRDKCVIQHPVRGPLPCELRSGCPVMPRSQGLELLDDLENGRAGSLIECQKSIANWWMEEFPLIPQRLLRWTEGQDQPWKSMGTLPWNRHKRRRIWKSRGVVLHLFAGRDHRPWEAWQQQGYEILCLDIQRGGDLHQPAVWAFLWELASSNKLVGIIGGPPCRSVSRLRSRQPGPVPLRGRSEEDRWGLPGLSVSDQSKTDYDSMLLLKQIALWRRAEETRTRGPPTMFLMESPEDPANYLPADESENLPSFWTFPEVKALAERPGFRLISFDQGTMGHARRKPTSLLCNMGAMEELNEMRVSGKAKDPLPQSVEDSVRISESWSKWAPGLVEVIVRAGLMYLEIVSAQPSCRKLDVEGFRRHIQNNHVPYRRDCRQCLETMGQSEPHRRLKLDGAAYCLSIDLAGPFPLGKDEGFNKKTAAKYVLVGSVAIPKLDRGLDQPPAAQGPHGAPHEEPSKANPLPEELQDDPKEEAPEGHGSGNPGQELHPDQDLLPEGPHEGEVVTDEEVSALNMDWKEKARELSTTVGLQQITMVEVLESRNTKDVVPAVGRLYARMKAYGIPIHRIHSDRERCFITTSFRDFCLNRSLYQTMTSGDTPQENGRVESEIGQVKRRLRLMLAESKLPRVNWPSIARWVGEQRCRSQLAQLGIPTKPMISPGTKVMVKQKLWNKKQGALSNPYKRMTLLGPSPLMSSGWVVKDGNKVQHAKVVVVEAANSEAARLELEEARPRRLQGKQRRDDDQLQLPAPILSANPDPADPDLALHPAEEFDPGTMIAPEVEYEPESPLPDDGEEPALRVLQAGGESQSFSADRGEYVQCGECGLLQQGGECGFCSSTMTSRTKVATMMGSSTLDLGNEYWNAEIMDSGELIDQLRSEHWEWKKLWNQELAKVAVGAEAAACHGEHLEFLENVLLDFEEELEGYGAKHEGERACLKALADNQVETSSPLHPVLQTYTVGLAEVRGNMTEREGAIRKELTSLFDTTKALRRTTVKELASWPGADQMEQAPMKLVATVKAPDGRRKARLVLCGNLIQSANGAPVTSSKDPLSSPLYAGGLDGVALRTVLRKAAACSWSLASTDVRTAFLLAPRQSDRLLVVRPPQLLVDHNLAGKDERWVVDNAVYGLDTSPKDWSGYRDVELARMTWTSNGHRYRFVMSTEPNLWKIMRAPVVQENQVDDDMESAAGFLVTYVDDLLCLGPRDVVEGGLSCIRGKWDCSPEEWVDDNHWMKFCGMELRWKGTDLLIGQPSYARELLNRHGNQQPRSTPAPKVDPELEEDCKTAEEVKQAQQVVGELLWLSIRTRPDLSYIVAWMGRHVARAPKMVCQVSKHVLGYIQETLDYVLVYSRCPEEGEGSLMEVVALSDASHAPGGGRGCQGIMMMWGDAVIQWEARAQPFAALSSTEAELIGYVDAMTMGESLGAIINAIEGNRLALHGCYRLKGDNLSGLQLLVAPDGPWRTRHLRLRSYVLRERIASGAWVAEHVPGTQLSVDLMTKPIVVAASWEVFRSAIGLREVKDRDKVADGCLKGVMILSRLLMSNGINNLTRVASAVGLSTLVACLHVGSGRSPSSSRGAQQSTLEKDLTRARCTAKAGDTIGPTAASPGAEAPMKSGEVEKRKGCEKPTKDLSRKLRDDEPNLEHVPHVKALRMSGPLGRSASIAAAEAMEMEPPFDFWPLTDEVYQRAPTSGKDQWVRLGQGWWCKQHKEWRITSFNPIHRNVPFAVESLVPERFTLCYWRDAQGRWLRQCHQDGWMQPPKRYLEGEASAVSLQWIGYSFFKIEENLVDQSGNRQPPVVRSDLVDWGDAARGSEMPPPDRIAGGPKARARAAGYPPAPMVLRGSIRRSFPGGILPSQQQGILSHRPGHQPEAQGSTVVAPTQGAYQPSATPYYSGGPTEVPYQAGHGEGPLRAGGLHGEEDLRGGEGLREGRGESETATSDVVTEWIQESQEEGSIPDDGGYRYMLAHVVDTVEDMMWQSGRNLPLPQDPMPAGEGATLGAAFQNGHRPHLASLRPLSGQAFNAGLAIPRSPASEAFEDTMSDPGEAITRLLEPPGEPHRKGAPGKGGRGAPGKGGYRRRVPAGHPEWQPPPAGGQAIEIVSNPSITESDDGFELLDP